MNAGFIGEYNKSLIQNNLCANKNFEKENMTRSGLV